MGTDLPRHRHPGPGAARAGSPDAFCSNASADCPPRQHQEPWTTAPSGPRPPTSPLPHPALAHALQDHAAEEFLTERASRANPRHGSPPRGSSRNSSFPVPTCRRRDARTPPTHRDEQSQTRRRGRPVEHHPRHPATPPWQPSRTPTRPGTRHPATDSPATVPTSRPKQRCPANASLNSTNATASRCTTSPRSSGQPIDDRQPGPRLRPADPQPRRPTTHHHRPRLAFTTSTSTTAGPCRHRRRSRDEHHHPGELGQIPRDTTAGSGRCQSQRHPGRQSTPLPRHRR